MLTGIRQGGSVITTICHVPPTQIMPRSQVSSGFWKLDSKGSLLCTHCNFRGHTREGCFELIGYPGWFHKKGNKGGNSSSKVYHTTSTTQSSSTLTSLDRPDDERICSEDVGTRNIQLFSQCRTFIWGGRLVLVGREVAYTTWTKAGKLRMVMNKRIKYLAILYQ